MQLHDLTSSKQSSRKRVGRGGKRGTTSGRGSKGQRARSGGKGVRRGFEGGRTSLIEQLPKVRGKGFSSVRPSFAVVNLQDLDAAFEKDADVSPATLRAARLIGAQDRFVKVLGTGTLSKALTVSAHAFSASAKEQIEKAGGTVNILVFPERKGQKPKEERQTAA